MYRAIVRKKIVALFEAVNQGNAEPVISSFAARFEHVFLGESALGGRRRSIESLREWYGRLFRLLPDISFQIEGITVVGTPWNTLAVAEWRESNSGTDGVPTQASGIHVIQIAWGRMTRLHICPDTVMLKATLDRLARSGITEAKAPMIED